MKAEEVSNHTMYKVWGAIAIAFAWAGSCAYGEVKKDLAYKPPVAPVAAVAPPPVAIDPPMVDVASQNEANEVTNLEQFQPEPSYGGRTYYSHSRRRGYDGAPKTEYVRGHFRGNGTFVHPYTRRHRR
jgi:hypothetical protein